MSGRPMSGINAWTDLGLQRAGTKLEGGPR
jgi:hypothetical protein